MHCRLWSHRHILFHRCPRGKHIRAVPKVKVGTATGQTQQYTGGGDLELPHIPSGFSIKGHIMPGFRHTLIGVSSLCDANCKVTFTRKAIIVRDKQDTPVLTGWSEATGSRLWRIALQPGDPNLPSLPNDANLDSLASYSAYELPSVVALIR